MPPKLFHELISMIMVQIMLMISRRAFRNQSLVHLYKLHFEMNSAFKMMRVKNCGRVEEA